MKTLFSFAVIFFIIYIHFVGATTLPQSTADGLIFCCSDDDGDDLKKPETMGRLVSSLGSENRVRISQQKCLEHSAKFCPEPSSPIYAVVGGTPVRYPGEFPHMVALGWRLTDNAGFSWFCGGSLVSEVFVLTAAHCTFSRGAGLVSGRPEIIRLGELDFTKNDTELQDIQIQSIIIHPEYKPPSKYHDIALLRLATPAKLTYLVRPVCLWQNETIEWPYEYPLRATAIGWGRTSQGGSGSDILQSVSLSFFTNQQCLESFGVTRTMNQGVIPQQICAGDSDGGKDTCSGDSGGPLSINLPSNRVGPCVHHQVGVTSFGMGCGSTMPAVYTRVSQYLDWIERIVWP